MRGDRTPVKVTALERPNLETLILKMGITVQVHVYCSRSIVSRNNLHRFLMPWNPQLYDPSGTRPRCESLPWGCLEDARVWRYSTMPAVQWQQGLICGMHTSDHTVLGPSVSLLLRRSVPLFPLINDPLS